MSEAVGLQMAWPFPPSPLNNSRLRSRAMTSTTPTVLSRMRGADCHMAARPEHPGVVVRSPPCRCYVWAP